MALKQKRVLEGTKDEFRGHLAEKLAAQIDVVEGRTKAGVRQKKEAELKVEVLEEVLSDFDDWELTGSSAAEPPAEPPDQPAAPTTPVASNGDAEARRRAEAAAAL